MKENLLQNIGQMLRRCDFCGNRWSQDGKKKTLRKDLKLYRIQIFAPYSSKKWVSMKWKWSWIPHKKNVSFHRPRLSRETRARIFITKYQNDQFYSKVFWQKNLTRQNWSKAQYFMFLFSDKKSITKITKITPIKIISLRFYFHLQKQANKQLCIVFPPVFVLYKLNRSFRWWHILFSISHWSA